MTCPIPVTASDHAGISDAGLAVKPMQRRMAGPHPVLPAGSDPAIIGSRANQERRKP
jgi:hypothetical protein